MKRLGLFTLACALAAVAFAAAGSAGTVHWTVTHVNSDGQMNMIVGGCDGLVAESDVPVYPGFTHNFPVTVHINGWLRSTADLPSEAWTAHYEISGSGRDADGHVFTIRGTLTNDGNAGFDFFANGGNMLVRRDDGSFARGPADAAANSIVYGLPSAIYVGATQCRLG